jgi:hypothetical protein
LRLCSFGGHNGPILLYGPFIYSQNKSERSNGMEGAINTGDTAWLLVCCSLVLLMTPALALFYGGMVRRKNLLSTLTLSYIFMALAGVQWVLYGYSLAFGTDIGGLIGGSPTGSLPPSR